MDPDPDGLFAEQAACALLLPQQFRRPGREAVPQPEEGAQVREVRPELVHRIGVGPHIQGLLRLQVRRRDRGIVEDPSLAVNDGKGIFPGQAEILVQIIFVRGFLPFVILNISFEQCEIELFYSEIKLKLF